MKQMSLKSSRLVLALITAGVIGGAGVTAVQSVRGAHAATPVATAQAAATPNTPMALPDFSRITTENGPAVVNISVSGMTKVSDESPMAGNIPNGGDPFQEFFRRFQQGPGQQAPHEMPTRGQGSGACGRRTRGSRRAGSRR